VASVALQSLVSKLPPGKPLSTNAQLGSVKVYASIQLNTPGICQSIAQPSFSAAAEVIEICQAYVGWRYGAQPPKLNQLRRRWQDLKKSIPLDTMERWLGAMVYPGNI